MYVKRKYRARLYSFVRKRGFPHQCVQPYPALRGSPWEQCVGALSRSWAPSSAPLGKYTVSQSDYQSPRKLAPSGIHHIPWPVRPNHRESGPPRYACVIQNLAHPKNEICALARFKTFARDLLCSNLAKKGRGEETINRRGSGETTIR